MPSARVYVIHPDPQVRQTVRSIAETMHVHCSAFASTREFVEVSRPDEQACVLAFADDSVDDSDAGADSHSEPVRGSAEPGADGVHPIQRATPATNCIPMAVLLSRGAAHTARLLQPSQFAAPSSCAEWEHSRWEELLRSSLEAAENEKAGVQRIRQARRERDDILERLSRLTPSERDVLDHVLEGNLNKMIARALDVSVRTIEQRRRNIMTKMEVESLAELVRQMTKLQVYEQFLD
ncbi:MAG: LuxR C-terminal-related transcriptional regulator [Pirellulaceae bacterium]